MTGIINIIKQGQIVTVTEKVCGLIGGLYLIEASDKKINKTVERLKYLIQNLLYPDIVQA